MAVNSQLFFNWLLSSSALAQNHLSLLSEMPLHGAAEFLIDDVVHAQGVFRAIRTIRGAQLILERYFADCLGEPVASRFSIPLF